MSILGNRVLRREDPKFLTVGGTYVADLDLPGSAHLTFVRSSMAHARVTRVDTSEAASMPGVIGVYTNDDLGLARRPTVMGFTPEALTATVLASGTVRYVGEPIVAIVAETREIAADATELVVVDYEPLPVVVDPAESIKDEHLLFPEARTNTSFTLNFGGDETMFDDCEVVVEQTIANQRVAPCPLEGRSAAGEMSADGRLEFRSLDPGAARRARRARVLARARTAPGARHGTRRRRRFRREGARSTPRRSWWPGAPAASAVRCAGPRRARRAWSASGHGRGQVQHVQDGRDARRQGHRHIATRCSRTSGAYPVSARCCRS